MKNCSPASSTNVPQRVDGLITSSVSGSTQRAAGSKNLTSGEQITKIIFLSKINQSRHWRAEHHLLVPLSYKKIDDNFHNTNKFIVNKLIIKLFNRSSDVL